jgi:hypothetical protein
VLQTGSGAVQSLLLSHGSVMHVPTVPSVLLQYSPVAQWLIPPLCSQPVVQTPVLTVVVSQ